MDWCGHGNKAHHEYIPAKGDKGDAIRIST